MRVSEREILVDSVNYVALVFDVGHKRMEHQRNVGKRGEACPNGSVSTGTPAWDRTRACIVRSLRIKCLS
jgi:hypothetical protein